MIRRILLTLAALAGLAVSTPVFAQALVSAVPVASCNTKSYTLGVPSALTMTTGGELCDTGSGGGGGSNAAAGPTGSAVPADASYNGVNIGGTLRGQTGVNPSGTVYAAQTDLTSVNGVTILTASGATNLGSPRVTVAQDNATAAGCITGLVGIPTSGCVFTVQGAGATASPVIVAGRTAVGSAAANPPVLFGGTADATGTGNVQVVKVDTGGDQFVNLAEVGGSAIALGQTTMSASLPVAIASNQSALTVAQAMAANFNATVVGTGTFAVQDSPTATATGGATAASIVSANSTNATVVKNGAGTLYHISVQNSSTTAFGYLIFFNTGTTPTCTGTPFYGPVLVPFVGSTGNGGSGVIEDFAVGLNFSTGISYCITTASGGTGSVAASAITGGLGYK